MIIDVYAHTHIYIYTYIELFPRCLTLDAWTWQQSFSLASCCCEGCARHAVAGNLVAILIQRRHTISKTFRHGGFHKRGIPKLVGLSWTILLKWMILGNHMCTAGDQSKTPVCLTKACVACGRLERSLACRLLRCLTSGWDRVLNPQVSHGRSSKWSLWWE